MNDAALVRRVDSLVNLDPSLDKADYAAFYANAQNPRAAGAAAHFSNDDYSLVSVLYDSDRRPGPLRPVMFIE